jgi:WD40 repeat protein
MITLLLTFAVAPPAYHDEALPEHAVARLGTMRFRLLHGPSHAALSDDGQLVAALESGNLVLFDAAGRRLRVLWSAAEVISTGDHVRESTLAFAPDGKRVAVSTGRRVSVCDVATGKETFRSPDRLEVVGPPTFALGGRRLACATRASTDSLDTLVWSLDDGKEVRTIALANRDGGTVVLSPDGKALAAWGGTRDSKKTRGIRVYDVETGKQRFALDAAFGTIHHVLFTPDSSSLLTVVGEELTQWEVATGKRRWRREVETEQGPVLRLSADGKTLLTAQGAYARTLNLANGKRVDSCVLPRGARTLDARFTPAGPVVLGSVGSALFLWDVRTSRPLNPILGHVNEVQALAFTPDGRGVVSAAPDGVRRWKLADGKDDEVLSGRSVPGWGSGHPVLSPSGRLVAFRPAGGQVTLYDTVSGKRVGELKGATLNAVAFSLDETRIAGLSGDVERGRQSDLTIHLYGARTKTELRRWTVGIIPHDRSDVALSPDGSAVVCTGSVNEEHPSFTLLRGGTLLTSGPRIFSSVVFSPCGRWLAGAGKAGIELVDAQTGESRARNPEKYDPLAFSPDGRLLAVGRTNGFRILEVESMQERLQVGGEYTAALAFSPTGRLLVAGGLDTSIVVYDVTGRAGLREFRRPDARLWAALGGESPSLASLYAHVAEAVALIRANLTPATGKALTDDDVRRLIRELGDDEFDTRERASKTLATLHRARPIVEAALKGELDLEVRQRLNKLIAGYRAPPDPVWLREVRAVEVLEHLGTPEARRLLKELSEGNADARLTAEARAALGRVRR